MLLLLADPGVCCCQFRSTEALDRRLLEDKSLEVRCEWVREREKVLCSPGVLALGEVMPCAEPVVAAGDGRMEPAPPLMNLPAREADEDRLRTRRGAGEPESAWICAALAAAATAADDEVGGTEGVWAFAAGVVAGARLAADLGGAVAVAVVEPD